MKRFLTPIVAGVLALSSTAVAADNNMLAFPGAEGFGRYATGGRGGEIYHVTNLNDSGAGSLRDAVSKENRIIVFDVCGTINIKSPLIFKGNNTVLGQTAPGEGVQVYGDRVSFSGATNLIVRYVRFHMGVGGTSGADACGIANGTDMIFDHCSVMWGRDENFSVNWDNKGVKPANITIQNSIIAQGLQSHSCGGLIQTDGGVTLYRNLYIENKTRNPKVKGLNQFVNNVVYNWGDGGCYIMGETEGASWAHIENNYFMNGPWNRAVAPFIRGSEAFHFYGAGNYYDDNKDGVVNGRLLTTDETRGWLRNKKVVRNGETVTEDWASTPVNSLEELNTTVIHEVIHKQTDSTYPDGKGIPNMDEVSSEKDVTISQPIPAIAGMMTAEDALYWIADNVGASLPARDEVDQYIIDELMSWGKSGTKGGISSEKTLPHKGTGVLSGGVKPLDTDGDGIPDAWETANGLNPNDASDAKAIAANGYANIENYVFTITSAYPYIKKPISLAVTNQGKTSLTLSWDLNKNTENGFIVEYSTDGTNFVEAARVAAGTTEYTINGLTENSPYQVRIRAFNADGIYSDYSDTVTTETIGDPAPPTKSLNPFPANGSKEAVAAGVKFTWENTSKDHFGQVVYSFYLGTAADALELKADNLTAKTYTVSTLEAGKTYYWRVDARNNEGTTTGDVWSFSATAGGVLFYTDFYKQPEAWFNKFGNIGDNTNVVNAANATAEFDGMVIGTGDEAIRIIAMSGANNSTDGTKDYGPATAEDAGASDRCLQFYTTKAGGYVMTPTVTGPCVVTVYAGNPDKSSKTIKLNAIINGAEATVTEFNLGAAKKVYKFQYTYTAAGNVQFKIDANAKKVNINDILVERYVEQGSAGALELTAGNLVNDNMSYADGSLQLSFNQDIVYNGTPSIKGGKQWEKVTVAAAGKKLTVNYSNLNVNTAYTVAFPEGAITTVDGKQSYIAELKLNTCDFPALKQDGETHFGKAVAQLPLNFAPFNEVAPFTTEGGLVQEKQNDYPHWVQASGDVTANQAVMTKTSDKIMCYYGPSSTMLSLDATMEGNVVLKVQESRNCDIAPGWRTIRTFSTADGDSRLTLELPLNPESHFVKLVPTTLSGKVTVDMLRIADDKGFFGDDYMGGIADVTTGNLMVAVSGNDLTVTGAADGALVRVFDIAGRLVGSATAVDGAASFSLTNGIFILTVDGKSIKVKI